MPELQDVLDDVQREVKRIGEDVPALKRSVDKDLADVRKLAEETARKVASDGQIANDLKALGEGVAAKHEAIAKTVKEIEEKALKAANDRLDSVEKLVNRLRLRGGPETGDDEMKAARDFRRLQLAIRRELKAGTVLTDEQVDLDAYRAYQQAFPVYLRKGERLISDAELKAMSVGSDPDGGYLAPSAVSARMLTIVYESSPMRALATVETISGSEIEYPIDEGETGAGWVGETESRPETSSPQVGVQGIPVHEMYAAPKVTQKLIEDASVDIEAYLARKAGEKFGRLEATGFVSGNGIKKPRGFLTYAAGTTRGKIEQVASGHATQVTADGLVNLTVALKEPYVAGASFLMRRATVGAVLLLKDTTGQYIWRPGLEAGKPSLLLGHPVYQAADMAAVGAGALAIAFGDFKQGYTIVDRLGISTLVDPYTAKPFVIFYSRKRVGGDVTNFEAIKLQVISA